MLLQFSVTNHRSIKETAIISMKVAADKTMKEILISPDGKKKLVPVMAIYGANAAGKSNVIHALLLMREMICGSYAKPLKGDNLPYDPFAFVNGTMDPTTFEIIYYNEGVKYAYGFSFDKDKIINEYLYHWPNGREALVFSREEEKYEFRESVQEQMTLSRRTSENRLYLTSSNEWNCSQTEKAYLWFQKNLRGVIATGIANEITIDAIRKGGEEKQRILNEMMFADLGICNVELSGTRENPIISTVHQRIDDSGKQNQYTHDTGLLDLKLLRRDQIWFAEKDEKSMQTDIYALTEFSPRKEENIARGYLQGRYGAIPFIGGGI